MKTETITVSFSKCGNLFDLIHAGVTGLGVKVEWSGYDLSVTVFGEQAAEFVDVTREGVRGTVEGKVVSYNAMNGTIVIQRN